jgi:hypothetical protein
MNHSIPLENESLNSFRNLVEKEKQGLQNSANHLSTNSQTNQVYKEDENIIEPEDAFKNMPQKVKQKPVTEKVDTCEEINSYFEYMIFGDGDGSGKNNGTYFEISFRNIAIEMYPSKITEKYKIKPRKSRYSLNTRLV